MGALDFISKAPKCQKLESWYHRDAQWVRPMVVVESTAHSAVQWHTSKKTQRMGTKEDIEIVLRVELTREADSRWFNQGF